MYIPCHSPLIEATGLRLCFTTRVWSRDYAQIPSSAVPLHPYLTLSRGYTLTQETTACLCNVNALGTEPLHLQPT
jgi:hypothetical protein